MTSLKAPFLENESIFSGPQETSSTSIDVNQATSGASNLRQLAPTPKNTSSAQSSSAQSSYSSPEPTKAVPVSPGTKISCSSGPLILPAVHYDKEKNRLVEIHRATDDELKRYFLYEVDVARLNKINRYLWLAGLPRPPRALHLQINIGREVMIVEQADLHMLWKGPRIFIKPLPEFLMCHQIWTQYLCHNSDLYEKAAGFLLSYVWLVKTKSDLKIAHAKGLLPETIQWEDWVMFSSAVARELDYVNKGDINDRYRRAELRLARINWIYRLSPTTFSIKNLMRGYFFGYHDYGPFIQRNLTWITATTVYTALVLTAMQVGLATDKLQDNSSFQNASFGFTVFSILAPLIAIGVVLGITGIFAVGDWTYTANKERKAAKFARSAVAKDFSKP